MFLERKGDKVNRRGWIEVVCGSMFSGKTEELIGQNLQNKKLKSSNQQLIRVMMMKLLLVITTIQ